MSPACTRTNPAISQPDIFHRRGIRYTQPAEKTWGMSPFESDRSPRRLLASATPLLATGPVKIVLENTLDASSISLENVYAPVKVKPWPNLFSTLACKA